jgi:signal transduction histidine kinase
VDLAQRARDTAREVVADRPECDLVLNVACEATVDCDPRLIGMALHNLLDNACKYRKADEPAKVDFRCEEREGERTFSLRDHGIGFDMRYAHKLFQPFERLHREEYAGTGIGLANVKRAIERHGGRVWAEGELGKGSTFYFTLP